MQMMTSELHLYSFQHLQPTAVCLPVSVQHLTYEDDDFVDADDDDDDDNDDDASTDDDLPLSVSMISEVDQSASTSANVSHFTPVRSQLL